MIPFTTSEAVNPTPGSITETTRHNVQQVLLELGSTESGLGSGEAARRLASWGPNALRTHKASQWLVLGRQLRSLILILLILTAGLSLLLGDATNSVVIGVILVVSVGLGFSNEFRAERAAEAVHSRFTHTAVVHRDTPHRAALEWAARRTERQKLPLPLVHAVPHYLVSPEGVEYQSVRAFLEGMLDSEANSVRELAPSVEVRSSLLFGEPAQVLAELSARSSMVVIGTDRRADVHGAGFGTLNFQLAMIGRCPVAVIPEPVSTVGTGVVAGIDGSPESMAAAYFAAAEAERTRQELSVICLSQSPARWVHASTDGSVKTEQIETQGRMILEAVVAAVRARHIHLTVFSRFEQHAVPARVLIEAGKAAAMLVVGSRGSGAAHHVFMDSATQELLLHVPCPLCLDPTGRGQRCRERYKRHGACQHTLATVGLGC